MTWIVWAVLKGNDIKLALATFVVDTACTLVVSVGMHWLALHKIEKKANA